jgi:23S rRNA (cytidine2498-2'-O)-methyltransferase
MANFYFALTNPEAEGLLKQEVAHSWPTLRPSYSRPGFMTFKGDEKKVAFNPLMARVSGECLGKKSRAEVLAFPRAWIFSLNPDQPMPPELLALSEKSLFKVGEIVTLVVMVKSEEFWVGSYRLERTHMQTPGEVSSILLRETPSRAYYKLAEAWEVFELDFCPGQRVLELGSAPGGASQFLLEQEMKVLGVDPGKMDEVILGHKNFRHLPRALESLTQDKLPEDVDWIISDVNLPPTVVLREIERLLGFLSPEGVVVNLKLNQDKHLQSLESFKQAFKRKGFAQVELKYLPSHRREIALIATHHS